MSVQTQLREPVIRILRGRKAILRQRFILEAFATQCGQPEALHWLSYYLNFRGRTWKLPVLVLVLRKPSSLEELRLESIAGASLFLEYRPLGLPTWSAITDDIVAPAAERCTIASIAANAMLRRGVHILGVQFVTACDTVSCPSVGLDRSDIEWTRADRELKQSFALAKDYDNTLAMFGKSTRNNFRWYKKRFIAKHSPEFVADANLQMSEADLIDLNAQCRNPVSIREVRWRYASSTDQSGFLTGLRLPNGKWVSALGGWRAGGSTLMQWQANADGYDQDSLVTVMRAYFLESEASRGTQRLILVAGTSHSMRSAFEEQRRSGLYVRRRSLRAGFVRAAARIFENRNFLTQRSNLLASTLRDPCLIWNSNGNAVADDSPRIETPAAP